MTVYWAFCWLWLLLMQREGVFPLTCLITAATISLQHQYKEYGDKMTSTEVLPSYLTRDKNRLLCKIPRNREKGNISVYFRTLDGAEDLLLNCMAESGSFECLSKLANSTVHDDCVQLIFNIPDKFKKMEGRFICKTEGFPDGEECVAPSLDIVNVTSPFTPHDNRGDAMTTQSGSVTYPEKHGSTDDCQGLKIGLAIPGCLLLVVLICILVVYIYKKNKPRKPSKYHPVKMKTAPSATNQGAEEGNNMQRNDHIVCSEVQAVVHIPPSGEMDSGDVLETGIAEGDPTVLSVSRSQFAHRVDYITEKKTCRRATENLRPIAD